MLSRFAPPPNWSLPDVSRNVSVPVALIWERSRPSGDGFALRKFARSAASDRYSRMSLRSGSAFG